MDIPQRFIVRRKGATEQRSPGSEIDMLMYLATSQQEAIRYGCTVFGCEENEIEAVAI